MTTDQRIIAGLARRRGQDAARAYACQTLRVYRQAVLNPQHFASTPPYRRAFIMSYLFYKHYLHKHAIPLATVDTQSTGDHSPSTIDSTSRSTDECERMIDAELEGTFPASDPPSWTMGGSVVSKHHRHRIGALHADALHLHFDQHS